MKYSPQSMVNGKVRISSLPTIFHQINEAVEDPRCSFGDVAAIVSKDPGLSARLLKLANSAYFGFSTEVETIIHAVTIIGMSQLRDLVLATTVVNHFKKIPEKSINMKSFWLHSMACGLAARIIAVYKREPNVERYYVLGMLHDLGRLVMCLNAPEELSAVLDRVGKENVLLFRAEREALGFDHADVGGELLKVWRLPARLAEPVQYHHNPSAAVHFPVEASIIHAADLIAHAMDLGGNGENFVPQLDIKSWAGLDIPVSMISTIVKQIETQLPAIMSLLLADH